MPGCLGAIWPPLPRPPPHREGPDRAGHRAGLVGLAMVSLVLGLFTGLVCASFRLAVDRADTGRTSLLLWSHRFPAWGWLVPVAAAALATAAARAAVERLAPAATGSGIPQVEAAVRFGKALDGLRVLVVTFVGGLAAIGAGSALGREGPCVSCGANLGENLARRLGFSPEDGRVIISGGAAAGLASAFGAPLAGAVFLLEEVLQRFEWPHRHRRAGRDRRRDRQRPARARLPQRVHRHAGRAVLGSGAPSLPRLRAAPGGARGAL